MTDPHSLAALVSADTLMRNLAALSQWTKLAGTPSECQSLKHIQQLLADTGYRTAWLEHDAYISLPGPARAVVDGTELVAITHSMAAASPPSGTTGRLVAIGEGSAPDFAAQDVTGCIVLVEGIASPAVALRASQAGAVGQLHTSPHAHLHEMCISPVWGSPSQDTQAMLPTTVTLTISHADGDHLRARLTRGETPQVALHAEIDTGWRKTPILVAELDAGGDEETPFILFSGHHDTWYHGVMDNGAANATMLEAARVLALHRDRWRRGLRLCFWSGHSQGRYAGSAWYADTHWAELDRRCAVHVNVDSTGGIGADVLGEAGSSTELSGVAAQALMAETGAMHRGLRQARNGDQSFWGIGIPSLYTSLSHQPQGLAKMRNALGWWWHTPDDLLDKIDPEALARDTRVYVHTLFHLLSAERLPLDHAAQLDSLLATLEGLASHGFDLAPLHRKASRLRDLAAGGPFEDQVAMGVCRALVPLDYTEGDRFTHDPALPQSPWPALDPLRRLAACEAGSDAARFAKVAAVRAVNRVMQALSEAERILSTG